MPLALPAYVLAYSFLGLGGYNGLLSHHIFYDGIIQQAFLILPKRHVQRHHNHEADHGKQSGNIGITMHL